MRPVNKTLKKRERCIFPFLLITFHYLNKVQIFLMSTSELVPLRFTGAWQKRFVLLSSDLHDINSPDVNVQLRVAICSFHGAPSQN